jgi:hypothetical protein
VTFHFALQQKDKKDTFAMQQDRFAMQQDLFCSAAREKEHQKEVLQNTNGTSWLSQYAIISKMGEIAAYFSAYSLREAL